MCHLKALASSCFYKCLPTRAFQKVQYGYHGQKLALTRSDKTYLIQRLLYQLKQLRHTIFGNVKANKGTTTLLI